MDYTNCPCCGKKISQKVMNENYLGIIGVHQHKCGAVFGQCYLGDSYRIVLPYWEESGSFENAFYYDLVVLSGNGVDRRHGWADKTTKKILQVG
jgi:hypothetical protein